MVVDVGPQGGELRGDDRRDDRQRPASRVAQGCGRRSALGPVAREPQGGRGHGDHAQHGHVLAGVERDQGRALHRSGQRDRDRASPGHDVRVGDDDVLGDEESCPQLFAAAADGHHLDRARRRRLRQRPYRAAARQVERRCGRGLDTREELRQLCGPQQGGELLRDPPGMGQHPVDGSHHQRCTDGALQTWRGAGQDQAGHDPDGENSLPKPDDHAAPEVQPAQHARVHRRPDP